MRIQERKHNHIRICLEKPIEFRKTNGFEKIRFDRNAKQKLNFDDIDLTTEFLGRQFKAPILIAAMTGGAPGTREINQNLAKAAERLGIGMGVGSQRALVENPELASTYYVRDVAPNIFLLGNLGIGQILKYDIKQVRKVVEEIGADGLAVHLNVIQEMVQPGGDHILDSDIFQTLRGVCFSVDFPVILKEVGCGICGRLAKNIEECGVSAIDVAGAGGTSWVKIEYYAGSRNAKDFLEYGIQTADCLKQCIGYVNVPIIASGGIRTGLDCAKALAMGSSLVGLALPLLKPATESWIAVKGKLEAIVRELKNTMVSLGAKNIEELKKNKHYDQ